MWIVGVCMQVLLFLLDTLLLLAGLMVVMESIWVLVPHQQTWRRFHTIPALAVWIRVLTQGVVLVDQPKVRMRIQNPDSWVVHLQEMK